ncbi:Ribulose-phosphate 3-epimerase [Aquicella siphonis]|uniref:Ribulose-phosphate 3-epimerase n=1 Tax=Aquicella siphonis TaxID=254247 RepID=A0A5E4PJK5_9COXI|nr:ribulose-phosphate 3-epimerase [Aquicella siphonis]VVC76638.1 Ribulose-phosphate 3-epimerase [Aquicella siphonis]
MQDYLILPSLLSADFARLGEEAEAVIDAGADMLHLDVMDNHYVPNLTVGPLVCEALRSYGIKAPIDVHLMTKPVDRLIIDFAKAGATNITFHPEASDHVDRSLALIRQHGCKAGLALNPATSLHCLEYVMDKLDLILIMSVNPGFGGQTFIPSALDKISRVRELVTSHDLTVRIAVDGGVKTENIGQIAQAGADMFIAGSAIFNQPDYAEVISTMRKQLLCAR